jgi:hypothetical protein
MPRLICTALVVRVVGALISYIFALLEIVHCCNVL